MAKKDAWTTGYQKTQAEYLATLKRERKAEAKRQQKKGGEK
jgi:hypothetical protein